MGCSDSQEQDQLLSNIEPVFMQLNLAGLLEGAAFMQEPERRIFMALNVCRAKPALFIPVVQKVRETYDMCKKLKFSKELCAALKVCEPLQPLRFDALCN